MPWYGPINWRGQYSAFNAYAAGDGVTDLPDNARYVAIGAAAPGEAPGDPPWELYLGGSGETGTIVTGGYTSGTR